MSSVSSPIHRFSGDYENLFNEQNFTADISNKMRVPSKILVTGSAREPTSDIINSKMSLEGDMRERRIMQVPDRIIVAGHEQHVGVKAPPRELHLEQIMAPQPSIIRVETPPRVLTLEDHYFPTVDDESDAEEEEKQTENHYGKNPSLPQNAITTAVAPQTPPGLYSDAVMSPTEEIVALRRHLVKLSRRVVLLEQEGQLRQQREMAVCSLGVAYFVLKTLLWLYRHW